MLIKILTFIDFLSPAPTLRIYSKSRYQTAFGGFFSILCGLAVVILSGYFVISTFSRNQIAVMYNEIQNSSPTVDFFASPHAFTITDSTGFQVPDPERYFNFQAVYPYMDLEKSRMIFLLKPRNCLFRVVW